MSEEKGKTRERSVTKLFFKKKMITFSVFPKEQHKEQLNKKVVVK